MASNLLELFNHTVKDLIVQQASGMLGESAESTDTAVERIASTLLGFLVIKCQSDAGVRDVLNFMSANRIDGSTMTNATTLLGGGEETTQMTAIGADQLKFLVGGKLSEVIDLIAGSSGLKTSSASYLLKLVSPFLLGVVGKYVNEKSLDGFGFKSLLQNQRNSVRENLPKGMAESIGMGLISTPDQNESKMTSAISRDPSDKTTFSKLLPWLVLLLTSLGLFYFVEKGCGSNKNPVDKTPTESPRDTIR